MLVAFLKVNSLGSIYQIYYLYQCFYVIMLKTILDWVWMQGSVVNFLNLLVLTVQTKNAYLMAFLIFLIFLIKVMVVLIGSFLLGVYQSKCIYFSSSKNLFLIDVLIHHIELFLILYLFRVLNKLLIFLKDSKFVISSQ